LLQLLKTHFESKKRVVLLLGNGPFRTVYNFEQTRFPLERYRLRMKLLKVVPALIVVVIVAVLTFKRGTIIFP
jgi:hypothetical protein